MDEKKIDFIAQKRLDDSQMGLLRAVAKQVNQPVLPKSNCRKCHGTGRLGFIDGLKILPLRCSCIMRKMGR